MLTFSEVIEPELTRSASELSPAQVKAVIGLATGLTVISAASLAGVHRATVHNWKNDPVFHNSLTFAQGEYAAFLEQNLKEMSTLAVDTIRHILSNPETSPAVRLRAALAVIDRPVFPSPLARHAQPQPQTQPSPKPLARPAQPQPQTPPSPLPPSTETGRNTPCPCGSGIKYKRCCGVNAPPILFKAA